LKTFFLIAWRNIWRNKRRTCITTAALVFSVIITILSITLNDGAHDDMLKQAIKIHTGYIQIQHQDYQDNPGLDKSFILSPELLEAVKDIEGVTGFSPRLEFGGLAATTDNSSGAMIAGVIPVMETASTVIGEKIIRGNFLGDVPELQVVIGENLAKNLNLDIGSDLALVTQGYDGSMGALRYSVAGIFNSGSQEMDRSMVYMHLDDAQNLVRAYDMISSIAIMTDSPGKVDKIIGNLQKVITDNIGAQLTVLGWDKLLPELLEFVNLDKVFSYIFLTPLLLIVIFGILSTILASVLERTNEFGVMLALGTKPRQIVAMIMTESVLLTTLGLILGLVIGLGAAYYFMHNPIPLPQSYEEITAEYGMSNLLRAAIYPQKIIIVTSLIIFVSLLFSFYPAWKASVLKPDKAIRAINH
jgi:putative ABC transport system permease protein